MSGEIVGLAVGLLVLTYLLWSDRHRLIDANGLFHHIKHFGLLLLITLPMGFAAYLVSVNWPPAPAPESVAQPPIKKLELTCTKRPKQKGDQKELLLCEGISPATALPVQEAKDPLSGKLELTFAVLGVLIALVTAISLTVAKNATEEAKRAEGQARDLREELDYISQAKLLAVRLLLQSVEIHTATQLARSPLHQLKLRINPTPMLEEKLKVLEELLHWDAPEFNAAGLSVQIDFLLDILDNPTYQPHLKVFFNERDVAACTALIEILRKPVHGVLPEHHQQAALSIGKLLRKLRTI